METCSFQFFNIYKREIEDKITNYDKVRNVHMFWDLCKYEHTHMTFLTARLPDIK